MSKLVKKRELKTTLMKNVFLYEIINSLKYTHTHRFRKRIFTTHLTDNVFICVRMCLCLCVYACMCMRLHVSVSECKESLLRNVNILPFGGWM